MSVVPPSYVPPHEDEDDPPLLGVRLRVAPLAGALPRVRRVGHARRGGRRARAPRGRSAPVRAAPDGPCPSATSTPAPPRPVPTGIAELDRVLGGGLVPGSVTLLGGEPGMGKSTLLLQALGRMAAGRRRAACSSAPRSRPRRCGCAPNGSARSPPTCSSSPRRRFPHVLAHADAMRPHVLALDSIQAVQDPDLPGGPGSVTQVRDGAYRLVQLAKEHGCATVLIGHVTKDGSLAGPRALEHVVDTVLSFDGDRHHSLRMLRALKHRFGPTDELGLFEMTERGLVDVPDASARFLADRRAGVPGSAVAAVLEGARPLLVEVQALVDATGGADAAPVGRGHGVGAARDAPRGARAARRGQLHQRRRLRQRRGWCAGHRARPRPRARARDRRRAARRAVTRATRSRSASSGSAVRCARCRSSTAGSPRRRGSGSAGR